MITRTASWLLAPLLVMSAACAQQTVEEAGHPEEAVAEWIAAVDRLDLEALSSIVRQDHVVLLVAAENLLAPDAAGSLIENGMTTADLQEFWSSFEAGFASGAARQIDALTIVGSETFIIGGVAFAAVQVAFPGERSGEVISRLDGSTWRLDLLASSGPALVRQLRSLIDRARADDVEVLLERFEDWRISLLAARERQPGRDLPADFGVELDSLISSLMS